MLLLIPMLKRIKRRVKKHKIKHLTRDLIIIFVGLGFLGGGFLIIWAANLQTPDLKAFGDRKMIQSTKIYDRTGEILLYDVHKDKKRTIISFEEIGRNIKNATVAIEDAEFYEHKGIKPKAILRAILVNLGAGKFSQGGSTITQQVVKNAILTPEKKISRKLKEWVFSIKLEREMTKESILTLYLNETPYGGNVYGIEEASKMFFGKSAKDLTLTESAYLAALPQAPTFFSPYGNNRDRLDERKNLVLKRMLELNFIKEEEYLNALSEEIVFLAQETRGIKAPHFVIFIREYLERTYGQKIIEEGGLKVITTLDYDLQQKAEEILNEYALGNTEKFNATNAGLIAIDPKTGEILTMVGSRDYFDEEIDGNFNITIAHRQPGSAFKPFVYATAFSKGYTPETVVFDLETEFQSTCTPEGEPIASEVNPDDCYMPENYDGIFRGPVSLRNALAQSINVPAIKTLYLSGLRDSLETARNMGIQGLSNVNQYGLTLVLGGGEVSLLDITSAYSVFANNGIRNPYTGILKIEDSKGGTMENFIPRGERVIEKEVALQISDILSDEEARSPAFGRGSYLYFEGKDVAAKTGTTNDYRDAWIVGYSPSIAVGTWAGNNDNSAMEKKVAGFIVAPMWNAFMKEALNKYPREYFEKPQKENNIEVKPIIRGLWEGGEQYFIDKISGKLATEYTPKEMIEEKVVTNIHSILYWVDKNNPLGDQPIKPDDVIQFNLWETPVRKWVSDQGIKEETLDIIPKEFDDIHKPEFIPSVSIIEPKMNASYGLNQKINILTINQSHFPIAKIDIFVNNSYIGSSDKSPFYFSFIPNEIGDTQKENTIKVIVYDIFKNKKEETVNFKLNK